MLGPALPPCHHRLLSSFAGLRCLLLNLRQQQCDQILHCCPGQSEAFFSIAHRQYQSIVTQILDLSQGRKVALLTAIASEPWGTCKPATFAPCKTDPDTYKGRKKYSLKVLHLGNRQFFMSFGGCSKADNCYDCCQHCQARSNSKATRHDPALGYAHCVLKGCSDFIPVFYQNPGGMTHRAHHAGGIADLSCAAASARLAVSSCSRHSRASCLMTAASII